MGYGKASVKVRLCRLQLEGFSDRTKLLFDRTKFLTAEQRVQAIHRWLLNSQARPVSNKKP